MSSSENGLDSRRLKDVRPRDPGREDLSYDSWKARVQHQRLVGLVGEAGAREYEQNLAAFRKEWARR